MGDAVCPLSCCPGITPPPPPPTPPRKQHLYQCDELSPFVQSCVDRFERLEESAIARTLENFLKM